MYTQCPECSTGFRVTAEVLKQASGKVRCGGCGNPFNALEYLSESMPEQPAAKEPEAPLPELRPEPLQASGGVPRSISAEQSAALLKTLDQLAGSDIRIEDTGVEWRVLDEDAVSDSVIDELLDESPTPIDQFLTKTPTSVEAGEIFDESANALAQTPVEELRFDDDTPLPDDFDLEDESSYLSKTADAEDSSPDDEDNARNESGDSRIDVTLGEPHEWADILGEVDQPADPDAAGPLYASRDAGPAPTQAGESVPDVDTQFALQAEAMGIDLSGIHAAPGDATPDVDGEAEVVLQNEADDEPNIEIEPETESESGDAVVRQDLLEEGEDQAPLEFGSVDTAMAQLEEESDVFDKEFFDGAEALELQDDAPDTEVGEGTPRRPESEESHHVVPPPTEQEQTLNMMIDQDLLNFAVEDKDGFASTIVIPEKEAEDKAAAEKESHLADDDASAGFETIIMEGDTIRSAIDTGKHAADVAAAAALARQAKVELDDQSAAPPRERRRGMMAAAVALGLLLVVQVVHQSREALATIPAFNNVVGPVYRAIGKPLSPAWDVTGWRFEATQDVVDEMDDRLSIYSRIGNKSEDSLPYPLINVALIDRYEEAVGNKTLDPAEYLNNGLDPSTPVAPGDTFNAVISIESPAKDATGYRLKACYRQSAGELRCSNPDFR